MPPRKTVDTYAASNSAQPPIPQTSPKTILNSTSSSRASKTSLYLGGAPQFEGPLNFQASIHTIAITHNITATSKSVPKTIATTLSPQQRSCFLLLGSAVFSTSSISFRSAIASASNFSIRASSWPIISVWETDEEDVHAAVPVLSVLLFTVPGTIAPKGTGCSTSLKELVRERKEGGAEVGVPLK